MNRLKGTITRNGKFYYPFARVKTALEYLERQKARKQDLSLFRLNFERDGKPVEMTVKEFQKAAPAIEKALAPATAPKKSTAKTAKTKGTTKAGSKVKTVTGRGAKARVNRQAPDAVPAE